MHVDFMQQTDKLEFDGNPVSILFVGDGFPVPRNSQTHMGRDGKPVPYEAFTIGPSNSNLTHFFIYPTRFLQKRPPENPVVVLNKGLFSGKLHAAAENGVRRNLLGKLQEEDGLGGAGL